MTKVITIVVVLLACSFSECQVFGIKDREKLVHKKTHSAGIADDSIRRIFRIISSGTSTEREDEQLVKLVEEEIVRTAQSIKMPSGSIEAAARRAQALVTELTVAYTTAIYKSISSKEAKLNFARFQNTVQQIVDFIKNGQFVL